MKSFRLKPYIIKILLLIIFIIYPCFLYRDFFNLHPISVSDRLKFTSIVLCFIIALLTGRDAFDSKDLNFLRAGLFMTTISDLCLLILNFYTLGVACFCTVQIIYSLRHSPKDRKKILIRFTYIFGIITLLFLLVTFFVGKIDILIPIALFYAICLGTSVTRAIKACIHDFFPYPNKYLIAFGMIFFLLCDINVGIFNISNFALSAGVSAKTLNNVSCFLIWVFYLPSQVMLSLSSYNFAKNTH